MASRQIQDPDVLSRPSETSSETAVPHPNDEKPHVAEHGLQEDGDGYENLNYPKPWKLEKWFVGGYSQQRMLKFKNPKRMYTAINLFAGTHLGVCGYCCSILVGIWNVRANPLLYHRYCNHVLRLRPGRHVTGQSESRLSDTNGDQSGHWYA